jgi:aspartyl-tRNA(Asn)/glutamyl-tRNA(Gln) amidotransferase subunit C
VIYSVGKKYGFMDKITISDIDKLATLARLGLTETEKQSLAEQMTDILEYVKQLDEVDVSQVEPTSQVTGLKNVTREDKILRSDIDRDELLSNTPDTENGFIKVKSVL